MEPEDLAVIGHTGNLLADIYTVKYGAYLHFTAVLNDGKGAQSRRNGCSICAVEVLNLARNTQIIARNQRALSGHSPDSTQISTVLKIGQSCRDSPPSSPLFSMQIMSVPFFSRSSLRIYRKFSGSQVVTTPKFKA